MSQYNPALLVVLTDRPVTGGIIGSPDHEAERNDTEARISDLNACANALATMQSGATAPTWNLRGQIWADISNAGRTIWKGDPDGAGADDEFLTRLEAYRLNLATGGTATFKLQGRLGTDMTSTSRAGNANTTFIQKTIPGGTLWENGQEIHAIFAGTKTGTAGSMDVAVRFGAVSIGTHSLPAAFSAGAWEIEVHIWRTAASAQKAISIFKAARDDTGSTSLVVYSSTLNRTLSLDQTLDLVVGSAGSAADTITQEIMEWEYIG